MKNEKNVNKTPALKTKVKPNNSIEVEIQKDPQNTLLGKILIWVLVGGMTILGLAALIVLIVQVAGKI